jgi:hypothetical protein
MVAVLPVVPAPKYCAVYNLAQDSYHGMEEVIGSIPIRSTKKPLAYQILTSCIVPSATLLEGVEGC